MGNTSIIKIQEDLNKIKRQLCCIRTDIDNVEIYNSRVSFSTYSGNFDTEIALGADDISFPVNPHEDDTIVIHFTDVVGYYTYTGTEWVLNWSTDIANVPVEFSQIQNIATNKLLGRSTVGSGVIEQISIGTGLSLSGGTLTNTVTASPPAGSDGQVQFNNSGAFGASSNLFWDDTTKTLKIKGGSTGDIDTAVEVKDSADRVIYRIANSGIVEINKANNALTQNTAVIKSVGSDANIGLALMPKGNGAITAQVPDGTATGGNARGQYAVDLQMIRDANTQVASGQYSTVSGGVASTASGQYSTVAGGASNTASAQYSTVAGGYANTASGDKSFVGGGHQNAAQGALSSVINGQNCIASTNGTCIIAGYKNVSYFPYQVVLGSSNAEGSVAQATSFVLAANKTGTSSFLLKGGDTRVEGGGINWSPLGTDRNVRVTAQVIIATNDKGNGSGTTGDVYASDITFTVKKVSNNISILASPVEENKQYDSSMSDLTISVTADNATKEVKIQVTPPSSAGSTTKFRAVATLRCTEVAW